MFRSSPKWAQQIKFVELCVIGDSVVAGLVPATSRDISRDISVKDYTESHADLVDAWGQCQYRRTVAGTRPATTLPPVTYNTAASDVQLQGRWHKG